MKTAGVGPAINRKQQTVNSDHLTQCGDIKHSRAGAGNFIVFMCSEVTLDFYISKMGIRILVVAIIVRLCVLNSHKVYAWPIIGPSAVGMFSRQSTTGLRSLETQFDNIVSHLKQVTSTDDSYHQFSKSVPATASKEQVDTRTRANVTSSYKRDRLNKLFRNRSTESDWTELVLTIQWPQTFCMAYNSTATREDDKCVVPESQSNWTLHGLWPSNPGEIGPVSCNNSWQFDVKKVSDLVPQLEKDWPDFLILDQYYSLWAHEWDKHGTCASDLPALYGEHKYFKATLKLKQQYDILSILKSHEITPDEEKVYKFQDIFDAVRYTVGTDPIINCLYDPGTKKVYLSEVELCLDKQFGLVDCVPVNGAAKGTQVEDENCSRDKDIMYPPRK
ncbi:ribonuclease Oy-like [Diadema antillarum]|uniref:ribonuclease Oy-like n=1 Tax=Diadema antillarum TaxID=105358 RepID=UPI003A851818